MASKADAARNAAAIRRNDELIGSVLPEWAEQSGDLGEAGKRVQNAIRAMMNMDLTAAEDLFVRDAVNDAAEWLRLATLNMNRAANWPANGR